MSNEGMNLTNEPSEGTEPPAGWWAGPAYPSPGYVARTDGMDYEFNLSASGTVTVNGINLGPVAELAALVRDAKRFRKLAHFPSGKWGAVFHSMPLPELADALPEVES